MAINVEENQKKFEQIIDGNVNRDGIVPLMVWLREKTDFFSAPASTRFHGAEAGGLCQHSLNVYTRLKELVQFYDICDISNESIAVAALFHDLCKCNTYKTELRNTKDESGSWVKVPYYTFNEDFPYGNHGGKSVYLTMRHIYLSDEEAAAIQSHMGFAGESNITAVSSVYEKNTLAWLLHVADEAATYVDRC